MELEAALDQLYYDLTLNELRLMNDNRVYPNITYNSLLYLDLIHYRERCTVSYLAGALHISKPAVTAKVNELIRQGFVQKAPSDTDRRVHYLSLTPAVAADYKKYDKRLGRAAAALEARYSAAELATFREMLGLIRTCYLEEPG